MEPTRRAVLASAIATTTGRAAPAPLAETLRRGEPPAGFDLVDAHAHIQETGPRAIWPRDAEDLVADMDRCGIRCAVFSHLAAISACNAAELKLAHDRSAAAVERHRGRLRAYAVFQPHLPDASRAELDRILAQNSPFIGIKLHGPIHHYPLTGPAYTRAFAFAHEHALPVLYHLRESGEAADRLAEIANKYSRMRLILAHLWPGEERMPALMGSTQNVFADTCASSIGRGQMGRIIRAAGAGRILFGTDATYLHSGGQLGKVGFADVPEESKRLVLGLNARKVIPGLPRAAG